MRGYPAGEVKAYVEDNVTLPINRVTKCCQTCGFMSLPGQLILSLGLLILSLGQLILSLEYTRHLLLFSCI